MIKSFYNIRNRDGVAIELDDGRTFLLSDLDRSRNYWFCSELENITAALIPKKEVSAINEFDGEIEKPFQRGDNYYLEIAGEEEGILVSLEELKTICEL